MSRVGIEMGRAFEQIPFHGCFLLDTGHRYLAWNETHRNAMVTLTGRSPESGQPIQALLDGSGLPSAIRENPEAHRRALDGLRTAQSALENALNAALETGSSTAQYGEILFSIQVVDRNNCFVVSHNRWRMTELEPSSPDAAREEAGQLANGIINELNNLDVGLEAQPEGVTEAIRSRISVARRFAEIIASRAISPENSLYRAADLADRLSTLKHTYPSLKIEVELPATFEKLELTSEPIGIEQAVREIITNSVEAKASAVHLVFASSETDDIWPRPSWPYLRLEIIDNGEGLAVDQASRLFKPFTGSRRHASGVGLTCARALVEARGGTIAVLRHVRSGTRASIRLPIKVRAPTPQRVVSKPPTSMDILVVDDAPEVRRVLSRVLGHAGHAISEAEDGIDALEKLAGRGKLPDVVVLDLMMPRMDGVETYRALRAKSEALPILITSGFHPTGLGFLNSDRHARFLAKPFSPQEVLESLSRLLSETHA